MDEVMAERRRLFLEEMARIREGEQQAQEDTRAVVSLQPRRALAGGAAAQTLRPTHTPRPRAALLALVILCLALTFPVFGYIQREAQGQAALRARRLTSWSEAIGPGGPDDEASRLARLQRARTFFGLPDIVAVRRSEFGPSFLLRPGLSDAKIIAQARHIRDALIARAYPTRGPQPWRVGVCSADIPCPVAVVRTPGPGPGGLWHVTDGHRTIE